ncbi:undecaprenyl-diphosphate phosphatase [Thalassorhabdus alkalitolerans]|uniref:Undecaprenyl-diphosphatase n=1 Tax=Thalassorhabdus alkalitolerans TaxID=2282697 RepID=A0ABW0YRK4_9BACI
MSWYEALIFGIVQGLSEFLPISSTAHIVITQMVFGYTFPGLSFEIFLHIGSILAVLLYFRKDVVEVVTGFFTFLTTRSSHHRTSFFFAIYILVATFLTGFLGLLLNDFVSDIMKTPPFIAGALATTGLFLILIERFHKYGSRTEKDMTFLDSIFVGLGQTLAVLPGISRSGATLITALYCGLNRDTAVRYSFLLSIPVILGSSVLAFDDIGGGAFASIGTGNLIIAFIASFIFSWIGIVWLIGFLKKSKLIYFAIYCFVLAVFVVTQLDPTVVIDVE